MQLRDYQQNLLDEIESELAFNSGNYFIDSCVSSGKSVMISSLADMLDDNVFILINITALIDQIAETMDALDIDYSIIAAGYDDRYKKDSKIQLCMVQTLNARLKKLDLGTCEYVINDEAHKMHSSDSMMTIINTLNPSSRFMFSGSCYDSQGFQFPGTTKVFETVEMLDLIEQKHLAPVKYMVPRWSEVIDYSKVKKTGGEYNSSSLDDIVTTENFVKKCVQSMNLIDGKNKKTIVFCSSVEQAEMMTKELIANGYQALAVHSKMKKNDADEMIKAFRNNAPYYNKNERQGSLFEGTEKPPVKCLVSIGKLSAGFSVEDITLGVSIAPTLSIPNHVQRIGRLHRAFPGKEFAEFLDLGATMSKLGMCHDTFIAPPRTGDKQKDKDTIFEYMQTRSFPKIEILLKNPNEFQPEEITRKAYEDKLAHLLQEEKEFKENAAKQKAKLIAEARQRMTKEEAEFEYIKEIADIIKTTEDVRTLITAGGIFHTYMHGQPISKAGKAYKYNPQWLSEDTEAVLDEYPSKRKQWTNALRTRIRNICKQGKNYNAVKFFIPEFILQKYLDELETAAEYATAVKQLAEVPDMDIDLDEIPF